MGYCLYLTRAEEWFTEENPITFEEVESVLNQLPQGFSIDCTGGVSGVTPQGSTLTSEVGPYVVYFDGQDENSRIHIYFLDGPPEFRIREEQYLLPILELAEALGAKIQGEELEVYTRESVLQARKGGK